MDVCVVLYRSDLSRIEPGLRPQDRLIVVDNTRQNRGFARAANLAAAQGEQNLICFVNTDGDLTSHCLDRLEAAFATPGTVAASPDIGDAWNPPLLTDGSPSFLSGACLAVRRSAFEEVGGFDARLFMYGEDVDLSWKLRRLGGLVRIEDAVFRHDPEKRRPFRSLHRNYLHHLVVMRRHSGRAGVDRMLRDAFFNLRTGRVRQGLARVSGTFDYLLRGRRWV